MKAFWSQLRLTTTATKVEMSPKTTDLVFATCQEIILSAIHLSFNSMNPMI